MFHIIHYRESLSNRINAQGTRATRISRGELCTGKEHE
jgi:hypothetical protein